MIPVYVVNLARSPERRAFMAEGLARAGVAAEFVAAVDGRACRSPRPPRALMSVAETALILSHRKAWRRLPCAAASEYAVVLEDDVHLGGGFAALLDADWGAFPFDAVKLETMLDLAWVERRGAPFGGASSGVWRGALAPPAIWSAAPAPAKCWRWTSHASPSPSITRCSAKSETDLSGGSVACCC